jgi:hypothetical protein
MKKDIRSSILHLCATNKEFPSLVELISYTGQSGHQLRIQLEKLCERGFIERMPSGKYQLNMYHVINGTDEKEEEVEEDFVMEAINEKEIPETFPDPVFNPMLERAIEKENTKIKVFETKGDNQNIHKKRILDNIIKFQKSKNEKKIKKNDVDLVIPITRIAMLFIGIGAGIVSVFYTSVWLLEFLPSMLAILLSTIMVGFSILAFEVIIMFFSGMVSKHWSRWAVAVGFSLLWLIVAAFSITSTVAGQYNQHIKNSKEYAELNESKRASSMTWNSIQERKKELAERRSEKKSQLSNLINISIQATTIEDSEKHSRTLSSTSNQINQAENALNKIEAEIEKIREEERKVLAANPSQANNDMSDIPDFYSWVAKVMDIKKDLAQFWLSLFPAIFVDIISPVALAIAMFLKKKK